MRISYIVRVGALLGALTLGLSPAHAEWRMFRNKVQAPAKNVPAQRHVEAIFLHGLGGEPTHFPLEGLEQALAKLGTELSITAPWLRPVHIDEEGKAHGTGPHTMSDQLARARAAIDAHDGPVVLVGHSFGGKAALALAKQRPDKVKAVIAFAPSVKMLYAYYKNLTGERGLPDAAKVAARLDAHEQWLRSELPKHPPDSKEANGLRGELGYLATMKDLIGHDESNLELGVPVPTLHLHGTDDEAVSIHYARRFAEQNPKVKLVEYAGINHGMNSKDPAVNGPARKDMTVQINDFLKSLEVK